MFRKCLCSKSLFQTNARVKYKLEIKASNPSLLIMWRSLDNLAVKNTCVPKVAKKISHTLYNYLWRTKVYLYSILYNEIPPWLIPKWNVTCFIKLSWRVHQTTLSSLHLIDAKRKTKKQSTSINVERKFDCSKIPRGVSLLPRKADVPERGAAFTASGELENVLRATVCSEYHFTRVKSVTGYRAKSRYKRLITLRQLTFARVVMKLKEHVLHDNSARLHFKRGRWNGHVSFRFVSTRIGTLYAFPRAYLYVPGARFSLVAALPQN